MKLFVAALAAFLSLGAVDAEAARRLGGGRSFGKQSSNVTQREAARPAPQPPTAGFSIRSASPRTPMRR